MAEKTYMAVEDLDVYHKLIDQTGSSQCLRRALKMSCSDLREWGVNPDCPCNPPSS